MLRSVYLSVCQLLRRSCSPHPADQPCQVRYRMKARSSLKVNRSFRRRQISKMPNSRTVYGSVSQPFLPMPHFFHTKNLAPHQHTNKHNKNFKINGNLW